MPNTGDTKVENGKTYVWIKDGWFERGYSGGGGILDSIAGGINYPITKLNEKTANHPAQKWITDHPELWAAMVKAGVIGGFGYAGGSYLGGGSSGGLGGFTGGPGGGPTLANSGFMNSFGGQALVNAGLNIAGGYLQDRATRRANQANQDAIKERIKLALQQLSPEQIGILMKQFLPEIAAVNNPLQQTALQQLSVSQARQGLAGTPYGLTAEAGLRGQLANATSTQAFERAMQTAGQRASAVTGAPFVTQQPNTGLADAFSNTANQILLARALSQRNNQYNTPYNFGSPGGPQPWEIQQTEGTPYRWPFNLGRY